MGPALHGDRIPPRRAADEAQRFPIHHPHRVRPGDRGRGRDRWPARPPRWEPRVCPEVRTADPRSIIREGSGYWKYIPTDDGIQFVTAYDYRTRFGPIGALVDRFAFRPLIGWATAWSFDRLRLWLEDGVPPALAARLALTPRDRTGRARRHLRLSWRSSRSFSARARTRPRCSGRRRPGRGRRPRSRLSRGSLSWSSPSALLLLWHRRWPSAVACAFAVADDRRDCRDLAVATSAAPSIRVTLNLAVGALALVDLLTLDGLPSAARCRRRPLEVEGR